MRSERFGFDVIDTQYDSHEIAQDFLSLRRASNHQTYGSKEICWKIIWVEVVYNHIRNTPKRPSSTGAFAHAASAKPSTSRVCAGSITPSSHSRAVA